MSFRARHETTLFFLLFQIFWNHFAFAGAPSVMTFQSKIVSPSGTALEAASVNFRFTILDSAGTCVLYVEDYSNINMTGTQGVVAIPLGSGTKTYPPTATSLYEVFNNSTASFNCQAGGTMSPTSTDNRQVVMQFNDGSGWQTLPQMAINAVPFANYATRAESLGAYAANAYLRPATLPTCTAGQALTWDGTTFTCMAAGGGGSTYTGVTSIANASGDITLAPAAGTGAIRITSNTPSTSTTTGAVVITGGMGVSGGIFSGGPISSGSTVSATTSIYTPQLYGTSTPAGDIKIDGTSHATKGNTLIASAGGNVGIGTTTPQAQLHAYNGSVLFSGDTGNTPVSGVGTRLMWIPSKAAFRAGSIDNASGGDEWDDTNIGWGSVAMGGDVLARGSTSVMLGWKNRNTYGNIAVGLGGYNNANADGAIAIGSFNGVENSGAIALGEANSIFGVKAIGIGSSNLLSGDNSLAFGNNLTAASFKQVSVGQYNALKGSENATAWVATDPLFVIGNGTSPVNKSNALMILKDGSVGIGTTTPAARLAITPTANTKALLVSGHSVTGSNTSPAIDISGTWNTTGDVTFIKANIIDTASGSNSNYLDIQVNGTSSFTLDKWGNIRNAGGFLTGGNSYVSGNVWAQNGTIGSSTLTDLSFVADNELGLPGMTLTSVSKNLGIGTTSPVYRLTAVGAGGSTVGYFSDGTQSCSITPSSAGNISCSSDERLKKDIQSFSDSLSLEKILKLETVTYEWKNVGNGRHTGYIAQEVEKIAPEFVLTGKDGYKQVSYTGFIPWITGAIKALYAKIAGHDLIIEEQKRKITNLESENEELKSYLCSKDPTAPFCKK